MSKLSITDLKDFRGPVGAGPRRLQRPLDENGAITDDKRIKATVPTLDYLCQKRRQSHPVLASWAPQGQTRPETEPAPRRRNDSRRFLPPVAFVDDCIGEKVDKTIGIIQPGDVRLLENVRFYAEEEKNDPKFAAKLAQHIDFYVNDAFGSAHRAHASTEGVAQIIKKRGGKCAAGFLMEKELKYLGGALSPTRPGRLSVFSAAPRSPIRLPSSRTFSNRPMRS